METYAAAVLCAFAVCACQQKARRRETERDSTHVSRLHIVEQSVMGGLDEMEGGWVALTADREQCREEDATRKAGEAGELSDGESGMDGADGREGPYLY